LRDAASARPWWRRIAALRVLTRSGDERAPELLRRALFSGHKPLAGAAAALLAQDASRRAAEVLVEGLISDVYSSSRLATALEQNGSPVGDLLRPRLRDSDSRLRYWAAYLPERSRAEQDAAQPLAARRYEQFVDLVSAALARGSRLSAKVLNEESSDGSSNAHQPQDGGGR